MLAQPAGHPCNGWLSCYNKDHRINEFILLCQLYFPIRKQRWLALLSAIDFNILFINYHHHMKLSLQKKDIYIYIYICWLDLNWSVLSRVECKRDQKSKARLKFVLMTHNYLCCHNSAFPKLLIYWFVPLFFGIPRVPTLTSFHWKNWKQRWDVEC